MFLRSAENGCARSFPFTADLETILKDQLAIYEKLKKAGRVGAVRLPSPR
jgi:hypothetical protein